MDTDKRSDALKKALERQEEIMVPNQSTAELMKVYDTWWSTYDEFTVFLKYKSPTAVGDAVVKYLPDNRDVRVLDVAAGSGLVGEQLHSHGFSDIDALDPSEGMLNVAKEKKIYRNYIQECFPCEKALLKTNSYDVLTVSGGLGEGHMKCDCLPEMVRCVKTGGLVVISVIKEYLTTVAEYKDRFEPLMKQLEAEGQWQILERTVIPKVYHDIDGLLFVLRVTKTEN